MATNRTSMVLTGDAAALSLPPRRTRARKLLTIARQNPLATISAIILIAASLSAVFASVIAPYSATEQILTDRLLSPGTDHWLGTDNYGRDVFSRVLYGARVSLFIGLASTLLGVGIGAVIGVFSGYVGGWADLIVQRVIDAVMAIPGLVLLLTLAMVMGPTTQSIILALVIFIIPPSARIVRGHAITVSSEQYIEAARVVGASNTRIIFRHVFPNVFATVIVAASAIIGAVILAEASIGFLGLGVKEPTPTWGNMLSTSGQQYMEQAPWLAIAPGLAIMIVVGAFNLLGDGLRDVFDPRMRGR